MNPTRTIQSTWLFMLALQTIGSVDAKHKLPAPRQYVAINVLWAILFLMADTGFGRLASRLSLLIVVAASVIGPFGKRLVSWLQAIPKLLASNTGTVPSGSYPDYPAPAETVNP